MAGRIVREVAGMPRLVHLGIALAVAALALDLVVHLAPAPHHHHGSRPAEHLAHLVGLVAMLLVLAGVVVDGLRRQRAHRRQHQGGPCHAHR